MNAKQIIAQLKEAEASERFTPVTPHWDDYEAPTGHVCVASLDTRREMGSDLDHHIYDIYRRRSDGLVYAVAIRGKLPIQWCDAEMIIESLFPRREWAPENEF